MKLRNIIILLLMFSSIMISCGEKPEKKNTDISKQEQSNNKSVKKTDTSKPAKKETKTNETPDPKNDSIENSNAKIKGIESLEKEISNSNDRIYMFLCIISGGFLLIIIVLSIIFYRYFNKELDYINKIFNTNIKIDQEKNGNKLNWELEKQLKRIKDDIDNLKSKIGELEKKVESTKPINEIKNNQTQNLPKNKFLYAESPDDLPDDLIFSKFGKEPTGRYLYTIDTFKNTFTIDDSLKEVVRNIDKVKHACVIEGNTSDFSRYEIKEGKVKKIDDKTWSITEKIKLKLY